MLRMQWPLYSQFQAAIQFNDLGTAECLLKQGLDSDCRFGSAKIPALCLCSKSGHYNLVRLLIEHGCSVNQSDANGLTALHYACNFIFVDIARLLIENRADVNATNLYGCTPLHLSVQNKSQELVELLVGTGALLEKRNFNGQTALLIACKLHSVEMARYLLTKGANVNAMDKNGNTPLLEAIDSGLSIHTALIKLLLNAGADPNMCNKMGSIPLLSVIRRSSDHIQDGVETVQALIEHSCHINVHEYQPPFYGESALNISITRNQDAITEKLIRSGANVDEKSIDGHQPLVRLLKDGKADLVKLAIANSSQISRVHLSEAELHRLAHTDLELFNYFTKEKPFFPRLKQLCRLKLRSWFGSSADKAISQMQLPLAFRDYLLLREI